MEMRNVLEMDPYEDEYTRAAEPEVLLPGKLLLLLCGCHMIAQLSKPSMQKTNDSRLNINININIFAFPLTVKPDAIETYSIEVASID